MQFFLLFSKVLKRGLSICGIEYYKLKYFNIELDKVRIDSELTNNNHNVIDLSYNDFIEGHSEYFTDSHLKYIKESLSNNDYHAYGIVKNGKLVYSAWISYGNMDIPIKLNENLKCTRYEGYLVNDFCIPSERGKGYHTFMLYHRLNLLKQAGKSRAVIIIMDGNTSAIKPATKIGFKFVTNFYCGKIFGIPFCTLNKNKYDSK